MHNTTQEKEPTLFVRTVSLHTRKDAETAVLVMCAFCVGKELQRWCDVVVFSTHLVDTLIPTTTTTDFVRFPLLVSSAFPLAFPPSRTLSPILIAQ